MPQTESNNEAINPEQALEDFLSNLLYDQQQAAVQIEYEPSECELADWNRLINNPAWKELESIIDKTIDICYQSYRATKTMNAKCTIDGKLEVLETIKNLPYQIKAQLEESIAKENEDA